MRLDDLSDSELEARFLEAEENALAWAGLDGKRSAARGSRWMQIAGELRAELLRRAAAAKPKARRR